MGNDYKEVKKVLWIILVANFVVAALKIIVGAIVKSASMTADGFHAVSDGSSNIVGLIGISFASKPIDKEHPYGHNKFEMISSLFIGMMLLFIAIKIVFEAILRFTNPITPYITIESLIALIITIFINIFVSTYENRKGKKLNSYILISDSLHTKSDIFVSIGVLITLIGIKLGLPVILDPIVSLVVSGFVLHASYEIFKDSMGILVDTATVDEELIKKIIFEFDEVRDVHNIRSRGSKSNIYIDMHVMINPNISVEDSHNLTHKIEEKIKEKFNTNIQIIIHIEPFYEL
ncbi:cation transporter [Romboutsia maritimum]|uniref:Cation transporter n=1 Tax=Romboutsia maritimum TaxID=2020948 RepID=A0A371IT42_9FIRM|nr:cation diffusion facilitator family transporter [Romboutsia maritimum]RDY23658.1 cation transporter [Romboutsia maritimum]